MLLTITTTHRPATDLGYLLHKSPYRAQSFDLAFGKAHVFYPEASEDRCTAAVLLDVDPVGLVRGRRGGEGALAQYVNDRPYVASSFLSVALSRVLRSAMAGKSDDRPDLAGQPLPLKATLAVVPSRGGERFLRSLFEPLGYKVTAKQHPVDPRSIGSEWGPSRYFTVTLEAERRLSELLTHLYVLVPVLDDNKHYYVGDDEVEKLLRHGEGWLAAHPERDAITRRYLKHRRSLARAALERLVTEEAPSAEEQEEKHAAEEERLEAKLSLNDQRLETVMDVVRGLGPKRVVDLGCGEGKLVKALLRDKGIAEVVGMDVSLRALEIAEARLDLEHMPERQRQRVRLLHGSLMYRDKRLAGFDVATAIEVIEHLDEPRLVAFERVLFEFARPGAIVLTTPNAEYNVKFENLASGAFRHKDHRFEWTRAQFEAWAARVAARFGYAARVAPVGPVDEGVGAPTQMAVFQR